MTAHSSVLYLLPLSLAAIVTPAQAAHSPESKQASWPSEAIDWTKSHLTANHIELQYLESQLKNIGAAIDNDASNDDWVEFTHLQFNPNDELVWHLAERNTNNNAIRLVSRIATMSYSLQYSPEPSPNDALSQLRLIIIFNRQFEQRNGTTKVVPIQVDYGISFDWSGFDSAHTDMDDFGNFSFRRLKPADPTTERFINEAFPDRFVVRFEASPADQAALNGITDRHTSTILSNRLTFSPLNKALGNKFTNYERGNRADFERIEMQFSPDGTTIAIDHKLVEGDFIKDHLTPEGEYTAGYDDSNATRHLFMFEGSLIAATSPDEGIGNFALHDVRKNSPAFDNSIGRGLPAGMSLTQFFGREGEEVESGVLAFENDAADTRVYCAISSEKGSHFCLITFVVARKNDHGWYLTNSWDLEDSGRYPNPTVSKILEPS